MCLYHRFVTSIFNRCLTSEIATTIGEAYTSDFATWILPKIAVISNKKTPFIKCILSHRNNQL